MDLPKGPPKILIADDNAQNVELLEAYLAGVDCELRTAIDGEDTLRVVAEFEPDLLLLDVMMPRLSGFEVCKKLRADSKTKDILILMVPALNEPSDFERGVQVGTDDFLTKPVNKVELLCRIKSLLEGPAPQEPARADPRLPGRGRGRIATRRPLESSPSLTTRRRSSKDRLRWPAYPASSSSQDGRVRSSPVIPGSSSPRSTGSRVTPNAGDEVCRRQL